MILSKPLEKLITVLIALFLAASCAIFPENGAYYATLTQGLDILAGANASPLGFAERSLSAFTATIWNLVGTLGLRVTLFILVFVITGFGILFILTATRYVIRRFPLPRFLWIGSWLLILVITGIAGKTLLGNWSLLSLDRRLVAPLDLLDFATKQKADTLYFNPYVRRYVRPLHSQWLSRESEISWKEAAENPSVWRKLDRIHRFNLVLLSGPTAEFKPLLDHLLTSPDWQLIYFDNGGFAFARQTQKKELRPVSKDISDKFEGAGNKAVALAQTAMQCAVMQDYETATTLLRDAEKIDKNCPDVFATQSLINLERKNWSAAIHHADEALALNPTLLSALQIKAQALLKNKDIEQAYLTSLEIRDLYPDDFYSLLLHAQIANTAHAYQDETRTLGQILKIAEKNRFPTGVYRVFLGQSYARQGLGKEAIDQFQAALNDPAFSSEQKTQINESLKTVRQRMGMELK
ncbi:MAG: hypothetical protein ABI615_05685 [Chthoniobacterales bacterium]